MYDKLYEQKEELLEEYERAEENGNEKRMNEISQKLKEISDFLATEFF